MTEHHQHHHIEHQEHGSRSEKKPKSTGLIFLAGIAVLLILGIIFAKDLRLQNKSSKSLNLDQARAKATEILAKISQDEGLEVKLSDISAYNNGLFLVNVAVNGQKFESYMSADGQKFFVQPPIDVNQLLSENKNGSDNNQSNNEDKKAIEVPKSDKPKVELFVMSHCPYGVQMEKGIIPAVEALGNKIDFEIKFVDYAMHGEKEVVEQLRQYCISKEQKGKLLGYLKCFNKAGNTDECLKTAGIDKAKLDKCYKDADNQFKVMANFNDKNTWNGNFPPFNIHKADNEKYGVQGSPTLVINGVEVQSSRNSASLLTTICNAFNAKPAECDKKLDSANPSPGFGEGTTASATDASCN